eukprot:UN11511
MIHSHIRCIILMLINQFYHSHSMLLIMLKMMDRILSFHFYFQMIRCLADHQFVIILLLLVALYHYLQIQ